MFVHSRLGRDALSADWQIATVAAYWTEHREEMVRWMDSQIGAVAAAGQRHGIPCGNTEGWGEINLLDHPFLDRDWVKECGEICVDLALKHGYLLPAERSRLD